MSAPTPWDEARIRAYSTRGFLPDMSNYPGGALAALQLTIAEVDRRGARLAQLDVSSCAYCGEKTARGGRTPEEFMDVVTEHVVACEKRPEKRLLEALLLVIFPLGIKLEDFQPGNVDGIAAAVAERWEKVYVFNTLRPLAEYHEDHGSVIWWHLPISEPPVIGGGPGDGAETRDGEPTSCQELHDRGWLTHWSPLPRSEDMRTSDDAKLAE